MGLKDSAERAGIRFGTAVGYLDGLNILNDPDYASILPAEFDLIACGNEMKFDALEPTRGAFNFTVADNWVSYAKAHGQDIFGQVLLWWFQVPAWYSALSASEKRTELQTYIQTVVNHFGTDVPAWDCVNELVVPDAYGDPTVLLSAHSDLYPSNPLQVVDNAFLWAHEVQPSLKLYYNDYDFEFGGAKTDAIYAYIANALSRGIPIHGIGFQCHINAGLTSTNFANWRTTLQRFASLGLEMQITELDVKAFSTTPSPATLAAQATVYKEMVAAALEFPQMKSVTVWGFADKWSWLADQAPCLWDVNYVVKPAYYSTLQALDAAAAIRPSTSVLHVEPGVPSVAAVGTTNVGVSLLSSALPASAPRPSVAYAVNVQATAASAQAGTSGAQAIYYNTFTGKAARFLRLVPQVVDSIYVRGTNGYQKAIWRVFSEAFTESAALSAPAGMDLGASAPGVTCDAAVAVPWTSAELAAVAPLAESSLDQSLVGSSMEVSTPTPGVFCGTYVETTAADVGAVALAPELVISADLELTAQSVDVGAVAPSAVATEVADLLLAAGSLEVVAPTPVADTSLQVLPSAASVEATAPAPGVVIDENVFLVVAGIDPGAGAVTAHSSMDDVLTAASVAATPVAPTVGIGAPSGITLGNHGTSSTGTGTSLVVTVPSGSLTGKFLVAVIGHPGAGINTPSGWTLLQNVSNELAVFYRFGDGVTDTTFTGLENLSRHVGVMVAFDGVNATPMDTNKNSQTGSGSSITVTGFNTGVDKEVVLLAAAFRDFDSMDYNSSTATWNWVSGGTALTQTLGAIGVYGGNATSDKVGVALWYGEKTSAGATGNSQVAPTTLGGDTPSITGLLFAIKPA